MKMKILIALAGLSLTGCEHTRVIREVADNYTGVVDDVRAVHTAEEIATWREVNDTAFASIEDRANFEPTKKVAKKLGDFLGTKEGE